MCGRCACTREPHELQRACAFSQKATEKAAAMPKWATSSLTYYPSYNIPPQSATPVLLSGDQPHLKSCNIGECSANESGERVLQTMKWGLIPHWHKELSDLPLLNNCRSDGMMKKVSFRNAVQNRQRCVVIADGYFEWQQQRGNQKQPFFIYFAENGPTAEMAELGPLTIKSEKQEVASLTFGPPKLLTPPFTGRLLTMAGIFDAWRPSGADQPLYTYSVITVDAHPTVSHIHERMPAILDGDEEVSRWLCPDNVTTEVLDLIRPCGTLAWHPVSRVVSNVRNKSPECVLPIDTSKQVSSKQNTLLNWFSQSPKVPKDEQDSEPSKKPRLL